MIIDCISDLHGHYPQLEGGDLLIVAGDLTARDNDEEWREFINWIDIQKYKKRIFIGGNHDVNLEELGCICPTDSTEYLCDSSTEFEGLKIWGSPWTKKFAGMNPHTMAFTEDTEEELSEKWKMIPSDVDILVTHSPAYGILDGIPNYMTGKIDHVGSLSLLSLFENMHTQNKFPKLHICGHVHEQGGKKMLYKGNGKNMWCINASHVNERYQPVNSPIRITL